MMLINTTDSSEKHRHQVMAERVVLPCDDQNSHESSPSLIDRVSTFLATYTTPLYYSQPESDGELFVFWSHIDRPRPRNNPSSYYRGLVFDSHNPREIRQTIKSAFLELKRYPLDVLIQFWSPVEAGSITTYDQPFALKHLDSNSQKHRLCSLKYQYNIDANKVAVEGDPLIINGAPANAFLNHMAEVVLDLRVHQGSPLVGSALECGFMSYFVMPICHQRSCVGVVECCAKNYDDLLEIFMGLPNALQAVGLSTFHGKEYLPYKTIGRLKHAMDEIEVALRKVCESSDLSLAQVSIAYGDGKLVPSSSSLENKLMKPMLELKLVAPCIDEDDEDDEGKLVFIDHCGSCDMVPLRVGKGLAGKALQNYEPHFCKNIYGMSNIDQLPATNTITKLSCFVICLRSIDTDNLDYVFEFLWPRYRNHFTMIESLMSTLKIRLPNFKFASGAQLGDELRVIDVGNPSRSMTSKGDLHVCAPTLKRKCNMVYWRGPKRVKRKTNTHKDRRDNGRAIIVPWLDADPLDPDTVVIKALYKDSIHRLYFPPSLPTFEAVEEEVAKKLKLIRGSFELTYRDEKGKVNCLVSDQGVSDCLKSSTNAIARIHVQNMVRMG